ncbi:MAG: CARDB domain-containing protein, partial [Geminicoccales bacterium]
AVEPSTTRFYLSSNVFLDGGDPVLAGSRSVPGLAAGAASSGTTAVVLPTGISPGRYYLIAKADADDAAIETNENNNHALRAITTGPDLRVSTLSVAYTLTAGSSVPVSDTVTNQGAEAAGASTTRFYLSDNVFFDAGDMLLSGERAVPAVAAASSSTGTTLVTIPAGTPPGRYYLFGQADSDGVVDESYETNNASLRFVQVEAGS